MEFEKGIELGGVRGQFEIDESQGNIDEFEYVLLFGTRENIQEKMAGYLECMVSRLTTESAHVQVHLWIENSSGEWSFCLESSLKQLERNCSCALLPLAWKNSSHLQI
jgi:hypothetical protein